MGIFHNFLTFYGTMNQLLEKIIGRLIDNKNKNYLKPAFKPADVDWKVICSSGKRP